MTSESVIQMHAMFINFLAHENPSKRKRKVGDCLTNTPIDDIYELIGMLPELEELLKEVAIDKELTPT